MYTDVFINERLNKISFKGIFLFKLKMWLKNIYKNSKSPYMGLVTV